ncbi:MAG: hypothetical protein QHG99_02275 [Methanomicrobiales archaeon]|nr:hypothetical protein [Methanomicrobiales archaeon]
MHRIQREVASGRIGAFVSLYAEAAAQAEGKERGYLLQEKERLGELTGSLDALLAGKKRGDVPTRVRCGTTIWPGSTGGSAICWRRHGRGGWRIHPIEGMHPYKI